MLKLMLRPKAVLAAGVSPEAIQDHRVKSTTTRFAVATVASLAIIVMATGGAKAAALPDSFADLAEEVSPAVVGIVVEKSFQGVAFEGDEAAPNPFGPNSPYREFFERFFGENFRGFQGHEGGHRSQPRKSLGSGFVVDAEGYVVTNNHVIDGGETITVTFTDGRELPAELIGADSRTDLALLKVNTDEALPAVEWGDSDAIRVGDWVMAVGNPFGLGGTVTVGVVSARGRDLRGGSLVDFLQLDAPINRGNSGGPAFNLEGEVIGINTAIFSPNGGSVGIGFAIPANTAEGIIEDLKDDGEVSRGWLGVNIQPITEEIAEGFSLPDEKGALIARVEPGSPAEAAGLKAGDVIRGWNGETIARFKDLPRFVAATPAGTTVPVEIWRDGKAVEKQVETGLLDSDRLASLTSPQSTPKGDMGELGLKLQSLDTETREALGLSEDATGVVITEVQPNSPAAEAGLRRGDVIKSAALEEISSAKELREAVKTARDDGQSRIPLLVLRRGEETFVTLPVQQG